MILNASHSSLTMTIDNPVRIFQAKLSESSGRAENMLIIRKISLESTSKHQNNTENKKSLHGTSIYIKNERMYCSIIPMKGEKLYNLVTCYVKNFVKIE